MKYDPITAEERMRVYEAYSVLGGTIPFKTLAERIKRDQRTIKKIIQDEDQRAILTLEGKYHTPMSLLIDGEVNCIHFKEGCGAGF